MYSSARTRGVYHVYSASSLMRSSARTRGVLHAYEEMEAAVDGAMLLQRFTRRVRSNNACQTDTSATVSKQHDSAAAKYNGTKKRTRSSVHDDISYATKPLISNRRKRPRPFQTGNVEASTLRGVRALRYLRDSEVPTVAQVDKVKDTPSKKGSSSSSGGSNNNSKGNSRVRRRQSRSSEGGASVTATGSGRTTEDDAFSVEEPPRRVRPRLWIKRSPLDD